MWFVGGWSRRLSARRSFLVYLFIISFWHAGEFNFFGVGVHFIWDLNGDFTVLSIVIFTIGLRTSFEE